MNAAPIITVSNLSKRYRLGQIGATSLRDSFDRWCQRLRGREAPAVRTPGVEQETARRDELWALREVSFDVQRGEAVGIIGPNGAGKTTLLKILSRITEPTTGRAVLRGRVGSLLEVGTGFHPQLTGRENVYLSGAILGMRNAEIDRKYDEIVAFSELAPFMATPVKRYSSGMYVRLGFAVAAHLEPEILLVDEVLAVGDVSFQKKCLGKMRDTAAGGRTVLFVSHNMSAIRQLCPRCLWVDHGRVRDFGGSERVVDAYLEDAVGAVVPAEKTFDEDASKEFQLRAVRMMGRDGTARDRFDCDEPVTLELTCQVHRRVPALCGYLSLARGGETVLVADSYDSVPDPLGDLPVGTHRVRVSIPARTLGPGDYSVYLNFTSAFSAGSVDVDSPGTVCGFRLDDFATRRGNRRPGFFSTRLAWDVDSVNA
ncbi:MAG: ABC transporter ATP-binding protein [Kiritimatiellae bacterium]|nr:ABC transporter ATP-binding protein [Kiritimatiellia bacterium]